MRERLRQMRDSLRQISVREAEGKTSPAFASATDEAAVREIYRRAADNREREGRFAREGSVPPAARWQLELAPWLTGATEYAERYGTLAQEARRWRLGFFVAALALSAAVAGLVVLATSAKVVPYVVQVDRHGYAVAIGPAEKVAPADERVIMSSVARFFRGLRSVLSDRIAQRALIDEAFVLTGAGTSAARKAAEYLRARDPSSQQTVEVEILRVAPMKSGSTLTVEWVEHSRQGGSLVRSLRYSALVSVSVSPTRALRDVLANPLGVYVTDFSISQL